MTYDSDTVSAFFGAVSIACWLIVSPPQIFKNFRRQSAEGLSIGFVGVWLIGDIANVLGASLQHVLPTMLALALYFAMVDTILFLQLIYYQRYSLDIFWGRKVQAEGRTGTEQQSLLHGLYGPERRPSSDLSRTAIQGPSSHDGERVRVHWTTIVLVMVPVGICGIVALSWVILSSNLRTCYNAHSDDFDTLGQVFGYLCASLYVGARTCQLRTNYRNKSTEGVSMLFFVFATIGNISYLMSIFLYRPCSQPVIDDGRHKRSGSHSTYARFIAVNFSWIIGSVGSLLLDSAMLFQFKRYGSGSRKASRESSALYSIEE